MSKQKKDEGFTLLEIVISIAILTMLMLPALSGYFTAARVNKQTQDYQSAINLGQNLAENLKSMSLEEALLQINGVGGFDLINSNLNGYLDTYQLGTYIDGGFGECVPVGGGYSLVHPGDIGCSVKAVGAPPVYTFEPPVGRGSYYLGLMNVKDYFSSYDVLITLDSSVYRDSMKYPGSMNNYKMPELNNLTEKDTTILDLEGFTTSWSDDTVTATYDNTGSVDRQALEYFKNIQRAYINYQESLVESGISPTPLPVTEYSESEIRLAIAKEIELNLKKIGASGLIQIECNINFQCGLDLDRDGIVDQLDMTLYFDQYKATTGHEYDRQIYLFYTPSGYPSGDTITVNNDGANIKLFLAKQEGLAVSGLKVNNIEINSADTRIYTNLSASNIDAASLAGIDEYRLIPDTPAKDRIFEVKVEVFPAGAFAAGDFTEPAAVYHITKENE